MTTPPLFIPLAGWLPERSSWQEALRESSSGEALGALLFLLGGAALRYVPDLGAFGPVIWHAGLVFTGIPAVWRILREIFAGRFASDIVAMLAIVGAAALDQPLAGLVIVLMLNGGELLERFAAGRASSALRALEAAAPSIAHVLRTEEAVDVGAPDVVVGDRLLVRPGELVPCDGLVHEGRSHLDVSSLTGEPLPVLVESGARVLSGSVNGEGALVMVASARARDSQYERIVGLVRRAQGSKAPLQRLADQYAVWFTPAALAICALVYWFSHDATRVLAVLVVATPCPLILAPPVAFVGGINRAARRRIIVRTAAALERLSGVTVAVLDKTGTVTVGRPAVSRVTPAHGFTAERVLGLAATVELPSGHLLARSVVDAARAAGLGVLPARDIVESPGRGVSGTSGGVEVAVGARAYILDKYAGIALAELESPNGNTAMQAFVAVDGRLAGLIEFADHVRPETGEFLRSMRDLGIRRTIMLSGDRADSARSIAAAAGITEVRADLLPEDKVRAIEALTQAGERVMMVGDGTNDAPALAMATVGIAMAGHGGGVTAEAADVVVLTDDLSRVTDALHIGRRTMRIARESILVGVALSGVAMALAAAGLVQPSAGALVQEAIDVAVIVNALRASRAGPSATRGTRQRALRPLPD